LSRSDEIHTSSEREDEHGYEQTDRSSNSRQDAPVDPAVIMTQVLLPFTHGIDASAISYALAIAQRLQLTLVVLSLIRLPETSDTLNPRLEDIQQSKDFLEFVHHRAARQGVPIVRMELYTCHPVRSIRALAREVECAGILLFVQRGAGVLLATEEVKQLLEQESVPLYIVPLLPNEKGFPHPRWLIRWFNR
jgi:hypothetical protein